ncbi:MAG: Zn-ribbon domain-containing OB-fold protein [Anaerolineae bacterium]
MTDEVQEVRPLSRAEIEEGQVLSTRWVPKASYAWDTGVAIGRYLAGFKEGQILGIRCPDCGRTLVPPRTVCELDFRALDDWVVLEDTGTVNTFSLCYVSWDVRRLEDPEIPAVIEIDGASEGMGILHRLGEVDPDQVEIGMKVQAVWKPPEERIGSVTDIRYFKAR